MQKDAHCVGPQSLNAIKVRIHLKLGLGPLQPELFPSIIAWIVINLFQRCISVYSSYFIKCGIIYPLDMRIIHKPIVCT